MPPVLTALDDILAPPRCALLVIDMQNDFIHPDGWGGRRGPGVRSLRGIVPVVNRLIRCARSAGVPICYITMEHGPSLDAPNYQARYASRGMADEILCAAGT